MQQLQVTKVRKALDGDISMLCGPWGHTNKVTAIREIELRQVRYFVSDARGRTADVIVVNSVHGKYLKTNPDQSCGNNLDSLSAC